jgi:hypothetical protein
LLSFVFKRWVVGLVDCKSYWNTVREVQSNLALRTDRGSFDLRNGSAGFVEIILDVCYQQKDSTEFHLPSLSGGQTSTRL